MNETRLMDPSRSRALLVGASRFGPAAKLNDLPTVRAGVEELERLLTDPARGGLDDSAVHVLLDPSSPRDVDTALMSLADEADDTLLVYYAGHGLPHPRDGSLHLAVEDTDRRRLHSTAYPIAWLRGAVFETNAVAKVVILDCCYSGRAIQTMSGGEVAEQVDVAGSFVLTAAPANQPAAAPQDEPYTAFTGALLRILRDGVADGPRRLDLDTIFRLMKTELLGRGLPPPQAQRMNEATRLALALNTAAVTTRSASELTLRNRRAAADAGAAAPSDRFTPIAPARLRNTGHPRREAAVRSRSDPVDGDSLLVDVSVVDEIVECTVHDGELNMQRHDRQALPVTAQRQRTLRALSEALARAAAERPDANVDAAEHEELLAAIGQELHDLLFPGELAQSLDAAISALETSPTSTCLRIWVRFRGFHARWLDSLPWEALCVPGKHDAVAFLLTSHGVTLTRRAAAGPRSSREPPADSPLSVLLVAPTPAGFPADASRTPATLQALNDAGDVDLVSLLDARPADLDVEPRSHVTPDAFTDSLRTHRSRVIHYVGYVRNANRMSPELAFTGADGAVHWLSADEFTHIIGAADGRPLVVLEAAGDAPMAAYVGLSAVAESLARADVADAVGHPRSPEPPVDDFARGFYDAVREALPVDVALMRARGVGEGVDGRPLQPAAYLQRADALMARSAGRLDGAGDDHVTCPTCGEQANRFDRYCTRCGNELDDGEPARPTRPDSMTLFTDPADIDWGRGTPPRGSASR